MKKKYNCWEYFNCGREECGVNADELGVCPASNAKEFDGFNHGKNAGRFCWFVAGTYCCKGPAGTYAKKIKHCFNCSFLKLVSAEEGREFKLLLDPQKINKHKKK